MEIVRKIPAQSLYSIVLNEDTVEFDDFELWFVSVYGQSVVNYLYNNGGSPIILTADAIPDNIMVKADFIEACSDDAFPSYAIEMSTTGFMLSLIGNYPPKARIYLEIICSAADWHQLAVDVYQGPGSEYEVSKVF